jgi:hypothetical protein
MDMKNAYRTEYILDYLLPYLLVVVLMSAVYSVYSVPVYSPWNLASAVLAAALFLLCRFVERHRYMGGALVTLVALGAIVLYNRFSWGNDWGMSFRQWFLSGADEAETLPRYLMAITVGFTTFFALTVYYFGKTLYRISFLTLVSLIPCVVYVKVVEEISNVYVILIAMLNVLVFMHHRRRREGVGLVVGRQTSLVAAAGFVFLLFFVTAAIPKERQARYYDYFENLFMGADTTAVLSEDYSSLNEFSGNADFFGGYSNRLMYTLSGSDVPYMKKHTFDYYDFDNDRWYKDSYYSDIIYDADDWYGLRGNVSLFKLQTAIRRADSYEQGFAEKYGLERLVQGDYIYDSVNTVTVHAENFGAGYYLVPARVLSVDVFTSGEGYGITRAGAFASTTGLHATSVTYRVQYYDEIGSRVSFLEAGGSDMDNATALAMLVELSDILTENDDQLAEVAGDFLAMQQEADAYRQMCAANNSLISSALRQKAAEITAGLSTDWEKAYALQSYFLSGEFTYDLKYKAPDNSPEYFLFTGKTGTCSDFASAYVLLARAAGLTVRYVEGYAPEQSSRYDDTYEIYDRDSHAYPEVFIQNMGWTVFEPTASSRYSGEDSQSAAGTGISLPTIEMDYGLMAMVFAFAAAVSIIVLIVAVVLPLVREWLFLLRTRRGDAHSVRLLYGRLQDKCRKSLVHAMTPAEFGAWFVEMYGLDVGFLVGLVEKCSYMGGSVTPGEYAEALSVYKAGRSAIRQWRRRRRRHGLRY